MGHRPLAFIQRGEGIRLQLQCGRNVKDIEAAGSGRGGVPGGQDFGPMEHRVQVEFRFGEKAGHKVVLQRLKGAGHFSIGKLVAKALQAKRGADFQPVKFGERNRERSGPQQFIRDR